MVKTVEFELAQATLGELIAGLSPGEEMVIVRNDQVIARLIPTAKLTDRPDPGLLKDALTIVAEDDEHLENFREYMP